MEPRIVKPSFGAIMAAFLSTFGRTDQEDPLKAFRYHIEIENFARFGFSKVSGLNGKTDVVKYREGGQNSTPQKSPGLTEFGDLTFERGVILAAGAGDRDIMNWYNQVFDVSAKTAASTGKFRRDIDIVLFNKEGDEAGRWRVLECWPSEHSPTGDLDAMSSNNVIEKMTITHEGVRRIS
jgi:phage tail-like protein